MDILTPEDIAFLRELANELKTQERFSTAKPVFYQIEQQIKFYGVESGEGDGTELIFPNDDFWAFESVEEAKDHIMKNYCDFSEGISERQEIDEINDLSELENFCNRYCPQSECYLASYKNISEKSGSFLTYRAAKQYLDSNGHHHNNTARVYCNHAWRNPEFERLLNIIEKFACEEKNP